MNALALMIRPTHHGWAVYLTDGRELARFRGRGSKWLPGQRHEGSADPGVATKGAPPKGATC
jgi:hypothetical protein